MTATRISGLSTLKGRDVLPMPVTGEPPNVTRFAPSPTGFMHLGHAYSALFAYEAARRCGGRFLLRMEDIDTSRCRAEFEQATIDDLSWLGITWDGSIRRQSEHMESYDRALQTLRDLGVVYPCFCTRKQIRVEIEEAGRAPHGPSGEPIYPGICRRLSQHERDIRIAKGEPYAWRLDAYRAVAFTGPLHWYDCRGGWIQADLSLHGDVVIGRKDVTVSYHLAVTLDDHGQGVSLVTRGEDLFHATHVHRVLQALLGLSTPQYYHHNLVADGEGKRLAKRNRAVTLRHLRDTGRSPEHIFQVLGLAQEPAQSRN